MAAGRQLRRNLQEIADRGRIEAERIRQEGDAEMQRIRESMARIGRINIFDIAISEHHGG